MSREGGGTEANETKPVFCGPEGPYVFVGWTQSALYFEANERNKIKILLRLWWVYVIIVTTRNSIYSYGHNLQQMPIKPFVYKHIPTNHQNPPFVLVARLYMRVTLFLIVFWIDLWISDYSRSCWIFRVLHR